MSEGRKTGTLNRPRPARRPAACPCWPPRAPPTSAQAEEQGRPLDRQPLLRLLLPRIVLRVDVIDPPRPRAVELDDRVRLGRGEVGHAGREGEEAAPRQRLGL